MLRDALAKTYQKVVGLQAILVCLLALAASAWVGQPAAISALVGGLTIVIGNLAYTGVARESQLSAKPAGRVLGRHLLAEASKLLVVVLSLALAFASGWFDAGWLLAAMCVALVGQWLALLTIR